MRFSTAIDWARKADKLGQRQLQAYYSASPSSHTQRGHTYEHGS